MHFTRWLIDVYVQFIVCFCAKFLKSKNRKDNLMAASEVEILLLYLIYFNLLDWNINNPLQLAEKNW